MIVEQNTEMITSFSFLKVIDADEEEIVLLERQAYFTVMMSTKLYHLLMADLFVNEMKDHTITLKGKKVSTDWDSGSGRFNNITLNTSSFRIDYMDANPLKYRPESWLPHDFNNKYYR